MVQSAGPWATPRVLSRVSGRGCKNAKKGLKAVPRAPFFSAPASSIEAEPRGAPPIGDLVGDRAAILNPVVILTALQRGHGHVRVPTDKPATDTGGHVRTVLPAHPAEEDTGDRARYSVRVQGHTKVGPAPVEMEHPMERTVAPTRVGRPWEGDQSRVSLAGDGRGAPTT